MSKPFIVWTMRRTGGTTFTNLLMDISEYSRVDHEPFNFDRSFGAISKAWYQDRDESRTRDALSAALRTRPLIKHCYEIHGGRLNRMLLETAERLGYTHVVLDRQDEVGRVLSLLLAMETDVWGKMGAQEGYADILSGIRKISFDLDQAVSELEKGFRARTRLRRIMGKKGITPFSVTFEHLYSDTEKGHAVIARAFEFLGFPADTAETHLEKIGNALRRKGQNSRAVLEFVENVVETQNKLAEHLSELVRLTEQN